VSGDVDVRDNALCFLSPDGELLEEHSLYDALSARPDIFPFQTVHGSQGMIDLLHTNTVRWMRWEPLRARHVLYAPGNLILTIRHQDRVVILDGRSLEPLWAWGQGELRGPHDADVLENGNLLVFDNGLGRGWSRVLELDPLTRTIVWEYKAPEPRDFHTAGRGSCQRLPNGNTLIAQSADGRAFEVTPAGEIVWEFFLPHLNPEGKRASFYRVYRYDEAFVRGLMRMEGE
jgi:hypothetical protein